MGSAGSPEVSEAGGTDDHNHHSAVEAQLHTGADSAVAVERVVHLSEVGINEGGAPG